MQLTSRYAGLELRLVELFEGVGGEVRRITLFRYSRVADRYVVYSRKL
jgi:hypothetical protein